MGILDYQSSFPPITSTLSEEKLKQRPIHERLVARNWKLMTPKDFRRLPPVQQGKWHNYENPRFLGPWGPGIWVNLLGCSLICIHRSLIGTARFARVLSFVEGILFGGNILNL